MKRNNRVKKHSEFDFIIKNGKKLKSKNFSISYLPSPLSYSRIGIAVGKNNGIAVTRVKIKRQIRAIFAQVYDFSKKLDVIVIARPSYDVGEFTLNKDELKGLLELVEE